MKDVEDVFVSFYTHTYINNFIDNTYVTAIT